MKRFTINRWFVAVLVAVALVPLSPLARAATAFAAGGPGGPPIHFVNVQTTLDLATGQVTVTLDATCDEPLQASVAVALIEPAQPQPMAITGGSSFPVTCEAGQVYHYTLDLTATRGRFHPGDAMLLIDVDYQTTSGAVGQAVGGIPVHLGSAQ
jgi:hypothetical protein